MKQIKDYSKLARGLGWLVAIIIVLLPFHAFMTVWLSSLLGHYTLLRLWKEFLLALIVAGALYLLFKDTELRRRFFKLWLVRLILAYILLLVVCAVVAKNGGDVTTKAMWYGLLVDLRFLAFFLAVLVIAAYDDRLAIRWRQILLAPAIIVAAIAVLQYAVLPYDFLKHFGYGPSTISPYETINHNIHHIRVASTLRGANPLGAYLILPIAALALAAIKEKNQRLNIGIFGAGLLAALFFSFSRSAWLGALLALGIIGWLSIKNDRIRKDFALGLAGLAVILAMLAVALRNNTGFESAIYHTDRTSTAVESSNQGHSAAFKGAARDIIHHPLGGGVGTAGPQSAYNDRPARIAEDYYFQIGQEVGIIGMGIFIAICVMVGKMLYTRRADPLALTLLASLIGLSFVGLLSHVWSDDTLAYIWWGLAGMALAPYITVHRKNT